MENQNENNEDVEHEPVFNLETVEGVIDELEQLPQFKPHPVKQFLSFTGGSILYCLSAASIIYGIGQIIGPTLAESILLTRTLPCLFAINLYELALLAVLVVIVRFRNVTDDAVSLLVLIALFLITSGLILGTLTPGNPLVCFFIGVVCIGLALWKLYILRRLICFPIGKIAMIGFGVIFVWNFLAAPMMGKPLISGDWPDDMRRGQWMLWWLVLLAGAGLIWLDALVSRTQHIQEDVPFIRRRSMVWVFALVLLVAAAIYQRATTFMYVIDFAWGDFLPLLTIFALLLIECIRSLGIRGHTFQLGVSIVPLAATMTAIFQRQIMTWPIIGVDLLWSPQVLLSLTGFVMLALAFYHRWTTFYYVALAYALGAILTFGYTPARPYDLNWELFAASIIAIVFLVGLFKQNFTLCFGAVILSAAGLGMTDGVARFGRIHDMTIPGTIFGIAGIGTLLTSLIFGLKAPKAVIAVGAVCLMLCCWDYLPAAPAWKDAIVLIGMLLVSVALWLRTGAIFVLPILMIPLAPRFYLLARSMSSWGFVVLSFVLLFLGGVVSFFFKNKSFIIEQDRSTLTTE